MAKDKLRIMALKTSIAAEVFTDKKVNGFAFLGQLIKDATLNELKKKKRTIDSKSNVEVEIKFKTISGK